MAANVPMRGLHLRSPSTSWRWTPTTRSTWPSSTSRWAAGSSTWCPRCDMPTSCQGHLQAEQRCRSCCLQGAEQRRRAEGSGMVPAGRGAGVEAGSMSRGSMQRRGELGHARALSAVSAAGVVGVVSAVRQRRPGRLHPGGAEQSDDRVHVRRLHHAARQVRAAAVGGFISAHRRAALILLRRTAATGRRPCPCGLRRRGSRGLTWRLTVGPSLRA